MSKSKYGHLTASLPKLPAENPAYQDRVEATKQTIITSEKVAIEDVVPTLIDGAEQRMRAVHGALLHRCAGQPHASSLAIAYAEVRALKDRIASWESNTNLLLEAYAQLMTDQMEVEGVSALTLDGVGRVSTWTEPYSRVADPEAFRRWFLADPDLSKRATLAWSTIDSLTRKMLLAGEAPPPGVEVYAKTKIRLGGE